VKAGLFLYPFFEPYIIIGGITKMENTMLAANSLSELTGTVKAQQALEAYRAFAEKRMAQENTALPRPPDEYAAAQNTDTVFDFDDGSGINGEEIMGGSIKSINAAELAMLNFPEPKQIVEGLIVPGVTLLVGASKIGKSWLTLDLCLSVAMGTPFLGRKTEQCIVWYLALEDSPNRMKSRLSRITDDVAGWDVANLTFVFDSPPISEGFAERLSRRFDKYIADSRSGAIPQLIVIDTLQVIRGIDTSYTNAYASDYHFIRSMKAICDKYDIAIVLVHHTNKLKQTDDPYEKISGSTGLMGAADTTILLERERGSDSAQLSGVSRDVCFDDIYLRFDNGLWRTDKAIKEETAAAEVDSPLSLSLCEAFAEADGKATFISYKDIIKLMIAHGGESLVTGREVARQIDALMRNHSKYFAFSAQTGAKSKHVRGVNLTPCAR
jgi:hypothetical protein